MRFWSRLMRAPSAAPAKQWQFCATPPRNGSRSGRYAILQVRSPRGYPNGEDYILLVRRPGELFHAAFMVHVPFDEEPPILLDYVDQPEVAVLYQGFTFLWTDNGGQSIRTPPPNPKGLFDLHRFGGHWIHRMEIREQYIYVSMGEGRRIYGEGEDSFVTKGDCMWRFRLDGSSDAAEFVEPPVFVPEPPGTEDLLAQGGGRLLLRASGETHWEELSPDELMEQLQKARVDFFGGSGARSFIS